MAQRAQAFEGAEALGNELQHFTRASADRKSATTLDSDPYQSLYYQCMLPEKPWQLWALQLVHWLVLTCSDLDMKWSCFATRDCEQLKTTMTTTWLCTVSETNLAETDAPVPSGKGLAKPCQHRAPSIAADLPNVASKPWVADGAPGSGDSVVAKRPVWLHQVALLEVMIGRLDWVISATTHC